MVTVFAATHTYKVLSAEYKIRERAGVLGGG